MDKIYKIITKKLSDKKNELSEKQKCFSVMCRNEIESQCFERNAINDLMTMQQLKSEISELEHLELLVRSQNKQL